METRLAVLSIIVENADSVAAVNTLLHDNADSILGRMGIPVKNMNVSVISIIINAPGDVINTLTGKLGMLNGVKAKTLFR